MICYVCRTSPCMCGNATRVASTSPMVFTSIGDGTMPGVRRCYTFAEAIRVAHEIGRSSIGRVKVRRQRGFWTVTYRYTPVLINGAA